MKRLALIVLLLAASAVFILSPQAVSVAQEARSVIVESAGFTAMVLGLQGQIKGEVFQAGTVGVYLLPDEESIVHAFEEKGLMQFATELKAGGVSSASPYFASNAERVPIGFPRYRTYFYNTSDKTVTVNLYAYLTS